jgi:hypothetical protein
VNQPQTMWPVQHDTRQKTKAPPMTSQTAAKYRPAGCSVVLKPQRSTPRIKAAIRTPAATSAGLMPVIADNQMAMTAGKSRD